MAISQALLTQNGDATNGTSASTASVAPGANKLELLAAAVRWQNTQASPALTVNGNGLTWVEVAQAKSAASAEWSIHLFRAMGASPSAGVITISSGAETVLGWRWALNEFDGVDTGGTNGSAAVVQSATNTGTANPLTVTLSAFGDAANAAFGAFGYADYVNPTWTPGTGFTELSDGATDFASLITEWLNGNDTSVDATCSSSGATLMGIAVEIKAAGGTVYTRTLSDSVATSDAPVRGVQAYRQMPADAVAVAELIMRGQMHGRIAADSLSVSEEVRRTAQLFRIENSSAAVSDSALRFVLLFRRLLDDASVTDALAVTITLGSTVIVTRVLQDGLNVQDAVARAVRMYRLESQALDVQDGTWYSASVVRGLVDVLSVAETAARALMRGRVITDTVEAADAAIRYALLYRILHDDADANDSLASTITYYETLIGFVLMTLRNDPIVVALDPSAARASVVRDEPIIMEMRNL